VRRERPARSSEHPLGDVMVHSTAAHPGGRTRGHGERGEVITESSPPENTSFIRQKFRLVALWVAVSIRTYLAFCVKKLL